MSLPALRGALRYRARRIYLMIRRTLSRPLDRRYGIETSNEVRLASLGLDHPDRVGYEPSGWRDLRRVIRRSEIGPGDVFIDLGSGKGRIVLAAARYPFRRVIGVEVASEINEVAARNVEAQRAKLTCQDVRLVTADVATYRIPDDVTVAYIYNAFGGDTFQAVVDELLASVDRAPRRLRLIYRTALEHERLVATGRFRLVRMARGRRPGRAWSEKMAIRVYALDPIETAAAERTSAPVAWPWGPSPTVSG